MRIIALVRRFFQTGQGRPAAIALLLGLALVAMFPQRSPFKSAQLALFDRYQSVFPRQRTSAPVTIVDIDEASLKRYGQWPWPRDRTAALVRSINALGPAAIGLDIYMPERDQTSPSALAERLAPGDKSLRDALLRLPAHDEQLAAALRAAPSVLGAAGFDQPSLTTSRGMKTAPVVVSGGDALDYVRRFPFVLASLPEFQAAAHGQALLSVDLEGGVVRRMPLVMAVGDVLVPSLAMEMLRVATGSSQFEVEVGKLGVSEMRVADLAVSTQNNGEVWPYFGKADAGRYVSAVQVLDGKAPQDMIRNKLVIIGLSGFGLVDSRITPLGEQVPGVEIQAQVIENLFDGNTLLRPRWMSWVEVAMLLFGGALLIWAVPALKPRIATAMATILFVALFGAGFAVFRLAGLLLDAASVFASINIVLGSLLGSAFIESDRQRRMAEAALHREREAAAVFAGELAAARRIQMGTLPDPALIFANEKRFEVAALLEPAREVGGDLYDFFMLDQDRMFFVVGDVSGKGVPASLFMAMAKALAKSVALRGNAGAGAIVTAASREIQRDNPESLFVTMLVGILDARSGALEFCIAGHDAPWIVGGVALRRSAGDSGPPLCVIDNFDYPTVLTRLAPGESLCVVTDGITEAMNAQRQAYGTSRVDDLLRTVQPGASAHHILDMVRRDVALFVDAAEASDDLTLLVIHRSVI